MREQLGTQADRPQDTPQALDQHAKCSQGSIERLARRLFRPQQRPQRIAACAAGEGPEVNQEARRCRRRTTHEDGSVAIEDGEVQNPLCQALHPLVHAGSRHAMAERHERDGAALLHLGDRTDDVASVIDLARQQIARQNPLARSAGPTTRQADLQPPITRGRLHTPLDPDAGEAKVSPAAAPAHATL